MNNDSYINKTLLEKTWHPVTFGKELKKNPLKVEVCGEEIVLFRDNSNSPVALSNRCPHRKAQLSCGKVKNGKIHCPYHGWNFDSEGKGESPNASRTKIKTKKFKAIEKNNLIWITSENNENDFSFSDLDGFKIITTSKQALEAPLEICVDNLLDQEHTNFVHKIFTFTEANHNFKNELKITNKDDRILVKQVNIRQKFGLNYFKSIGINWGKYSYDTQVVSFDPPKAIIDLQGKNSINEGILPFYLRIIQIYVPKNETETIGFTFFLSSKKILLPFKWLLKPIIWLELLLDKNVMTSIGKTGLDLKQCDLGKFDSGVVRGRKSLEKLYYQTRGGW